LISLFEMTVNTSPTILTNSTNRANSITIVWNENENKNDSSTFSAMWLWHNNPDNFLLPSGQRIKSPSAFPSDCKIVFTSIEPGSYQSYKYADRLLQLSKGSIHPINTKCERSNDLDHNQRTQLEKFSSAHFLLVKWEYNKETYETGYNLNWLRKWSYDKRSLMIARQKREITIHHMFLFKHLTTTYDATMIQRPEHLHDHVDRNEDGLIHVEFNRILDETTNSKLLLLDALFLDGAAIVSKSPDSFETLDEIVTKIAKVISGGSLSHGSLYGDTFHVKSVPDAINVAYTSEALCPHQDLAYYESKPGFQLLHCASMPFNIIGGESILIDCMAAAYRFREMAPSMFSTLVKCPVTFVKQREGACITYVRPHICLAHDGRSDLNDINREIVSVHWAPPFEGPLNILPDLMDEYYKAYAAFELMLDASKCPHQVSESMSIDIDLAMELSKFSKDYTWERRLCQGEILIFNNTRLLHGRKSFQFPGDCQRHLIGAYTNIDDSLNNYRHLLQSKNIHDRIIPNVGNGSPSVL
jgi:hypothetical protein